MIRGKSLAYPLAFDSRGKLTVSAFSIQLEAAREEWRRSHPTADARPV
jgi:hypothetical protein